MSDDLKGPRWHRNRAELTDDERAALPRYPRVFCWHGTAGQLGAMAWLQIEPDSEETRQAWWWMERLPRGASFRLELWMDAGGRTVYPMGEWVAVSMLRRLPPIVDGDESTAPLEVAVMLCGGRLRRARRMRLRVKDLTTYALIPQPGDSTDPESWSALLSTPHTGAPK